MLKPDIGSKKVHGWPSSLRSVISSLTNKRARGSPQPCKRSKSLALDRRVKTERIGASRRYSSTSYGEDAEIRRVILSILGLMAKGGKSNFSGKDSDDRSTCDSYSCSSGNRYKSTLLSLLEGRLNEIRNMHFPKTPHRNQAELTAIIDAKKDDRAHADNGMTAIQSDVSDCSTVEKKVKLSGIPNADDVQSPEKKDAIVDYSFYKRPMVNISFAKNDIAVVEAATKTLRWKTCQSSVAGDIFWFANSLEATCAREQMQIFFGITYNKVTLNRFNNLHSSTKKVPFACLAEIYERYAKGDPHLYSTATCPDTFLFPRGTSKVMKLLKLGVPMIIKPSSGSMGNGIRVVTSMHQIPPVILRGGNNYVCQVYVERPMLIDARKFDFRMYVLITNIGGGFAAFLSTLGIVRICTHPYQKPNKSNCSNPFMHLTNYSINRQHMLFQRSVNIADSTSNKRELSSAIESLQKIHGVNSKDLWSQMTRLSEAAVSILYPNIQIHTHDSYFHSFQIIGLDMLLDENAKMWLLEVNSNPSLHYTYQENDTIKPDVVDQHVKVSLVAESLKLIHRMRCEGLNQCESSAWIELRVRIPPEVGITTALYAECRERFGRDNIECDDWIQFCKANGLIALLRDSIEESNQHLGIKKNVTLRDAKMHIRDTFARTRSKCPLEGFPGFLSHMESIATSIYNKSKTVLQHTPDSKVTGSPQGHNSKHGNRDHHNARSAACLHKLLDQVQFYSDFMEKDAV